MVQKETIEQIRLQMADCSDDALQREFEDFFRQQPEICEFVMDVTSSCTQKVRELSLYLSYVTYKTLALDSGLDRPVQAPVIMEASKKSQEWIHRMSTIEAVEFESASAFGIGNEPYLLGFVATEVQDAIDSGLDLDEEEQGAVFFVLKTVIASLAGGPR